MVSVRIQIVSGSIPCHGESFSSPVSFPQTDQRLSLCDHELTKLWQNGAAFFETGITFAFVEIERRQNRSSESRVRGEYAEETKRS